MRCTAYSAICRVQEYEECSAVGRQCSDVIQSLTATQYSDLRCIFDPTEKLDAMGAVMPPSAQAKAIPRTGQTDCLSARSLNMWRDRSRNASLHRAPSSQLLIFLDSAYPRICGAPHIRGFGRRPPGRLREKLRLLDKRRSAWNRARAVREKQNVIKITIAGFLSLIIALAGTAGDCPKFGGIRTQAI
jgi:hypothetical protein